MNLNDVIENFRKVGFTDLNFVEKETNTNTNANTNTTTNTNTKLLTASVMNRSTGDAQEFLAESDVRIWKGLFSDSLTEFIREYPLYEYGR